MNAIEIRDLWKEYRTGVIGHGSLRKDLQSWVARMRGLEDPNSLVVDGGTSKAATGDRFLALREINLDVVQGEMLGIIGRNGAGKSTLLKILSRITAPSRGEARFRGRMVSLLEVGTGFHPELTGRENVFLNGAILGMKSAETRRKFDEIVEFSGVARFIDTPVKRYSSGMYVRLAFAVAAHLEPEILVVDEVLAVGDYEFQKKCMGKMSEVTSQSGRTVLLVSHNLSAVRRLCTKTALLSEGRLVAVGDTGPIVDRYLSEVADRTNDFSLATDPAKAMHVRRIRVLDAQGNPSLEAEYTSGFKLEVEYEVNEPARNCMIWMAVRTLEEILVFGSADYDMNRELLGPRAPGYYRTTCRIPAELLNTGSYYLVVGIVSQSPEVSYDRVELHGLTVIDTRSDLSAESANRTGLVKPRLAWETAFVSPPIAGLG